MSEHLDCNPGGNGGFVSAHFVVGCAKFRPCDGGEDVFVEGVVRSSCPPRLLNAVGEVVQVAIVGGGKVGGFGFVFCSVESTTHAVMYHGDGGLWVCGDGFLHGVVVITDRTLEGVGAIEDEADEAAHPVFREVCTSFIAEHMPCGSGSLSCFAVDLVNQCLSEGA